MDELFFFHEKPEMLPVYESVRDMICAGFDDVKVKVSKTQIAFSNKYQFAFVSLPFRKIKGSHGSYIIFTFGLGRKEEHPLIFAATEPYPGRWTHHVMIRSVDEIGAQIKEWIGEAYHFSLTKRRCNGK